jgi:hypothetical protein
MYRWINSKGETVRTKTVKAFAEKYGFTHDTAYQLSCGSRARLRGWCSTSKKPKAKKYRERFLTKLVNMKTGETAILGPSVKKFARDRGLSLQGFSELVNRRVAFYRNWTLAATAEILNLHTPDEKI